MSNCPLNVFAIASVKQVAGIGAVGGEHQVKVSGAGVRRGIGVVEQPSKRTSQVWEWIRRDRNGQRLER